MKNKQHEKLYIPKGTIGEYLPVSESIIKRLGGNIKNYKEYKK